MAGRIPITMLILALGGALAPAAVVAPPTAPVVPGSRSLSTLVQELNADVFTTRDAAEFELIDFPNTYPLTALEQVLCDDSLSPEQRHRLERVAYRRFADSPRGALGVTLNEVETGDGRLGVAITGLTRGFPAETVLKEGDVIVAVDGIALGKASVGAGNRVFLNGAGLGTSALRTLVISRNPGDTVALTVMRPAARPAFPGNVPPDAGMQPALPQPPAPQPLAQPAELVIKVELGDFGRLAAAPVQGGWAGRTVLMDDELRRAFAQRLARLGQAQPASINATSLRATRNRLEWGGGGGGDGGAVWINGRPVDLIDAHARGLAESGESPAVTPGGQPDARRTEDPSLFVKTGGGFQNFNQGAIVWGGGGGVGGGGGNFGLPGLDPADLQRMTDAELAAARRRLASWIFALADQPGQDRGQARALGIDVNLLRKQLDQVQAETNRRALKNDAKP